MANIPSILTPPKAPDAHILQQLGAIAPPGPAPAAYNIPAITAVRANAAAPLSRPGPAIASPTMTPPTPDPIVAHALAMGAPIPSRSAIGPIAPPGTLTPPDSPIRGPRIADLVSPKRIETAPSPASTGADAVAQAKAAESAIQPPQYTGKIGVLEKIGDVASRLLAPGIEHRLGIGTLGYQDRLATAKSNTADAEKDALAEAQTANEERSANEPYPQSPNIGKTVQVNGRRMQFDPKTNGYDIDLGPANAQNWTPEPTLGVEVNEATGETRPMVINGQPVEPPSTPERDKQRMLALEKQLTAGTLSAPDRATLVQLQTDAKLTGTKPEIIAQVGPPPVAASFQQGAADPGFKAAELAWGKKYEDIANQEANASGFARGSGWNATRPMAVMDESGNMVIMPASEAEARGLAPATQAQRALTATSLFNDIGSAIDHVRNAINDNGESAWSPTQVAKLRLAMGSDDPGVMGTEIANLMASGLNPAQQDLVTWLYQLQERALTLRSIAGMGQGSETTRGAILRALPNLTSGNKEMATKQLDAFANMVGNLSKGVARAKGVPAIGQGESARGGAPPAAGTIEDGFRFKGGNPADANNWERIQ